LLYLLEAVLGGSCFTTVCFFAIPGVCVKVWVLLFKDPQPTIRPKITMETNAFMTFFTKNKTY
jgi:hypothetical protein